MPERVDTCGVEVKMRDDWNERAREDAHFYVAFGRREQDPEEFFATGRDVVTSLERELRRLGPGQARARRGLEIGCGPARLMRPMSRHFGEIHGVDVSDEMIARARENLRGIAHAHAHHGTGSDLAAFADASFDFIYSYAVFQHIPSRAVVMSYLDEAVRVLKPGGVLRVQINGLPQTAAHYDTWSGVRIASSEVVEFARAHSLALLALEGAGTQYMWVTLAKRDAAGMVARPPARIRRITNAHSSEPVAPGHGRYASISAWVEHLPEDVDLLSLEAYIGGQRGEPCYIGPREADGLQQINIMLPWLERTGLTPVELRAGGVSLCPPAHLRLIRPGPQLPRLIAVGDGVDLLSGTRIVSGTIKVTLEETDQPGLLEVAIDGRRIEGLDIFCTDPRPPRYEINVTLPEGLPAGPHRLDLTLGRRRFGPIAIEVVK